MKTRCSKTALTAAIILLAMLLLTAAPAAAKKRNHGLFWGAWIGSQLTGTQPPWDMSPVTRFEQLVDKGLSLLQFASPFADCSTPECSFYPFPTKEMEAVRGYGAIPFLSWSSAATPSSVTEPDYQLSDLAGGAYDSYIREFATASRAWGHPFFLRFDWEMNGNWFPWSEGVNGNQPGEYVAAWRHVHDIFTEVGATNATWVWCPYADSSQRFGRLRSFYPGSGYVDWTCLDVYNWGRKAANPAPWKDFERLLHPDYRRVLGFAPHKPMMLAELGSGGAGKAKAVWIRRMFSSISTRFQQVRGLMWFDQTTQGVSWPLENSRSGAQAFAEGLHRNPYRGNRFDTLSASPIPPPR